MVSISIALSVGVLNLHFRGHNLYKLPRWIKKALFMRDDYFHANKKIMPIPSLTVDYKFNSFNQNKKNLFNSDEIEFLNNDFQMNLNSKTTTTNLSQISLDMNNSKIAKKLNKNMSLKDNMKLNAYNEKIITIIKLFKKCSHILEKESNKLKKRERLIYEWKEAAKRFDFILFIISFVIIFSTPIYFFAPYLFKNYLKNLPLTCGCSKH
jgi:hypothetical protein